MQLYDDFSTPQPDPEKWAIGQMPGPDGSIIWTWRDDNLSVACRDNHCELSIPRFSLSHDTVGIFDNPKVLYFSTRQWDCSARPLALRTSLAAEMSGDTSDYKDGFAGFHALDFATGTVMDIVANGKRVWAIFERLPIPGLDSPVEPFIDFYDLGVDSAPMREHELEIRYDPATGKGQWVVDGAVKLEKDVPMRPQTLFAALGILTLHPQVDGKSTSLRGQGGKASFGPFWYQEG